MQKNVFILGLNQKNRMLLEDIPGTEKLSFYPLLEMDQLVEALEGEGSDFVADGEIAAFEGKVTSYSFPYSRLQPRMHLEEPSEEKIKKIPVYYYLFDLVHLDGYDLSKLPLRKRKAILKELLPFEDPIRLVFLKTRTFCDKFASLCVIFANSTGNF